MGDPCRPKCQHTVALTSAKPSEIPPEERGVPDVVVDDELAEALLQLREPPDGFRSRALHGQEQPDMVPPYLTQGTCPVQCSKGA